MKVDTVLGPVDVAQLGRTLMHEHVIISVEGAELDRSVPFDRQAFVADVVDRLRTLRERHGVRTFVDPCPIEMGRDVRLLAEVSEKAEMHIICATGFYHDGFGIPLYWRMRPAQEIAAFYIDEIENGVGDTGIKPGLIKVATGQPAITDMEYKVIEAACIAQRATGVPILTHTEEGCCGPNQQAAFAKGGVPLHRCLIGHSCGNADIAYHRRIVEAGSYVGFDRIGYVCHQPDEVRADNVAKLVGDGRIGHLLLSQDMICGMRGRMEFPQTPAELAQEAELRREGLWPLRQTYIFDKFLPMLRARGLDDSHVRVLLDDNPRRFFSGEAIPFLPL